MSRSRSIWCPLVLTQSGWQCDVRITVDDRGYIEAVEPDMAIGALHGETLQVPGALVPGVPNLHSHAHQRAMAGLGERASGKGDSFWTWRKAMYRMLERIQPDQLYHIARMLYLEMLEAGYTHVAEFQYLHHDPAGKAYACRAEMTLQCARAAEAVGIGFTALPVLYRYAGFGAEPPGDGQKRFINGTESFLEMLSILEGALSAGQVLGFAPHSLRAVDASSLQTVLDDAPTNCPVHVHIAEQIREVDDCLAWSGMRPVEWLYHHFSPDPNWCLIHATHVTTRELNRIVGSGAIAGLCPTTEANLGDGLFPVVDFLAGSGRFGIGSDSHISISPVEELRWLEYGQRLVRMQRNCLAGEGSAGGHTGQSLLTLAATGGARACGVQAGCIAPGRRADLVNLDTGHPRLYGRQDGALLDSWVFSGNDSPIRGVFVAGQAIVESGGHRERDEIITRFHQTIDQLAQ